LAVGAREGVHLATAEEHRSGVGWRLRLAVEELAQGLAKLGSVQPDAGLPAHSETIYMA